MKKILLTIGAIGAYISMDAQVLTHVDNGATFYVSKNTLVYNGGGLQTKGSGVVENHGNVMVSGTASDVFKTVDASGNPITSGGNIINKINEPNAYDQVNTNNSTATPKYTYGQLYISGLTQANITGVVSQEYKHVKHGDYQQIAFPFYDKAASTLNTNNEFGKTFTTNRWSKNEILVWDNRNVVFYHLTNLATQKFGLLAPAYSYYVIGGNNLDVSSATRTIVGKPFSDEAINTSVQLKDAGLNINFGTGGNAINSQNEKYYTYVQDGFHTGTAFTGNYGRNSYQFGNPFLTNLDLSQIARVEAGATTDNNNLSNIQGVRLEVSGVQYNPITGSNLSSYKYITFANGVPANDVDYMMVRPMSTFVIKLIDNTLQPTFDFKNLRRFNYYTRADGTSYNVSASKTTNNTGTVKQLGVIGLNSAGSEVARTYYIVYDNGTTGYTSTPTSQVTAPSTNLLGTYEELPTGGVDPNYTGAYWLYSNEANEVNFKGKNIKLSKYSNDIVSYKFEIRENANLVADNTHALSSGIGFYYKADNGSLIQAKQGEVVPVTSQHANLYYGEPTTEGTLATTETTKLSRTMVVFDPAVKNYFVRFDSRWKKADVEVYDMSGKLILTKKSVDTSKDLYLDLDNSLKNAYVVKAVSNQGEKMETKILMK